MHNILKNKKLKKNVLRICTAFYVALTLNSVVFRSGIDFKNTPAAPLKQVSGPAVRPPRVHSAAAPLRPALEGPRRNPRARVKISRRWTNGFNENYDLN